MKLYKAKGQGIFVNNPLNVIQMKYLDDNALLVEYKDGNEVIVNKYNIIADPKAKMKKVSELSNILPKVNDRITEINIKDVQIGDIIEVNGEVFVVDNDVLNMINLDILGDGSCIAYYTFDDENANDLSGKYNGIWVGTEQYDIGKFGKAAKFDGNSGIASNAYQSLDDEIGLTFWFNFIDALYEADNNMIFNAGNQICELAANCGDKKSLMYAAGDGWEWIDSNIDLEKNVFYFFVVNYNRSSGLYEVYLNNEKIISYTNSTSYSFGHLSDAITFGYRQDNSNKGKGAFINGIIDQIRIFDRILTEEEIQKVYQETSKLIKKIV